MGRCSRLGVGLLCEGSIIGLIGGDGRVWIVMMAV